MDQNYKKNNGMEHMLLESWFERGNEYEAKTILLHTHIGHVPAWKNFYDMSSNAGGIDSDPTWHKLCNWYLCKYYHLIYVVKILLSY